MQQEGGACSPGGLGSTTGPGPLRAWPSSRLAPSKLKPSWLWTVTTLSLSHPGGFPGLWLPCLAVGCRPLSLDWGSSTRRVCDLRPLSEPF